MAKSVDIGAIVAAAVAEALAAAGIEQDDDTPAPAKKRTSAKRASTKPAKKSAARKAKPTPDVWIVKKSWKGVEPSPRMIGAALHWCNQKGVKNAAAKVEGLDKFDLSKFIGKTRGIRVKVEA